MNRSPGSRQTERRRNHWIITAKLKLREERERDDHAFESAALLRCELDRIERQLNSLCQETDELNELESQWQTTCATLDASSSFDVSRNWQREVGELENSVHSHQHALCEWQAANTSTESLIVALNSSLAESEKIHRSVLEQNTHLLRRISEEPLLQDRVESLQMQLFDVRLRIANARADLVEADQTAERVFCESEEAVGREAVLQAFLLALEPMFPSAEPAASAMIPRASINALQVEAKQLEASCAEIENAEKSLRETLNSIAEEEQGLATSCQSLKESSERACRHVTIQSYRGEIVAIERELRARPTPQQLDEAVQVLQRQVCTLSEELSRAMEDLYLLEDERVIDRCNELQNAILIYERHKIPHAKEETQELISQLYEQQRCERLWHQEVARHTSYFKQLEGELSEAKQKHDSACMRRAQCRAAAVERARLRALWESEREQDASGTCNPSAAALSSDALSCSQPLRAGIQSFSVPIAPIAPQSAAPPAATPATAPKRREAHFGFFCVSFRSLPRGTPCSRSQCSSTREGARNHHALKSVRTFDSLLLERGSLAWAQRLVNFSTNFWNLTFSEEGQVNPKSKI